MNNDIVYFAEIVTNDCNIKIKENADFSLIYNTVLEKMCQITEKNGLKYIHYVEGYKKKNNDFDANAEPIFCYEPNA